MCIRGQPCLREAELGARGPGGQLVGDATGLRQLARAAQLGHQETVVELLPQVGGPLMEPQCASSQATGLVSVAQRSLDACFTVQVLALFTRELQLTVNRLGLR